MAANNYPSIKRLCFSDAPGCSISYQMQRLILDILGTFFLFCFLSCFST
jgi:hypothetical protein